MTRRFFLHTFALDLLSYYAKHLNDYCVRDDVIFQNFAKGKTIELFSHLNISDTFETFLLEEWKNNINGRIRRKQTQELRTGKGTAMRDA